MLNGRKIQALQAKSRYGCLKEQKNDNTVYFLKNKNKLSVLFEIKGVHNFINVYLQLYKF